MNDEERTVRIEQIRLRLREWQSRKFALDWKQEAIRFLLEELDFLREKLAAANP